MDAIPRAAGTSIFQVRTYERALRATAINPRKEKCSGPFQNGQGRAAQEIGETDVDYVGAAAQRNHQTAIGIELHMKLRWPPFAPDAREHALKHGDAARNVSAFFSA